MKEIRFEDTTERRIEDIVKEGKIAVQYCIGQTAIWVPKEYFQELGAKKILKIFGQIFTQKELDDFESYAIKKLREGELAVECKKYNSYEVELPSLVNREKIGKKTQIDPEEKMSRLIRLLGEELK